MPTLGSPTLIVVSLVYRDHISVLRITVLHISVLRNWLLKLLKNIHPMKCRINTHRKRNELQNSNTSVCLD